MSDESSNEDQMTLEEGNAPLGSEMEEEGDANITEEPEEQATFNIETKQAQGDRTCATYCFKGEDHTLGNLMRFVLIKNPIQSSADTVSRTPVRAR